MDIGAIGGSRESGVGKLEADSPCLQAMLVRSELRLLLIKNQSLINSPDGIIRNCMQISRGEIIAE
jgi:hypothetical protein